jgi:hypothetical protein
MQKHWLRFVLRSHIWVLFRVEAGRLGGVLVYAWLAGCLTGLLKD